MASIDIKEFMVIIGILDIIAIIGFTVKLTSDYRKFVCDVQVRDLKLGKTLELLAEKVNNNHCDIQNGIRRVDAYLEMKHEDYIKTYWD